MNGFSSFLENQNTPESSSNCIEVSGVFWLKKKQTKIETVDAFAHGIIDELKKLDIDLLNCHG